MNLYTFYSNEGERMFSLLADLGADIPDHRQKELAWQRKWLVGTAFAPAPYVAYHTRERLIEMREMVTV